jgi:Spy/CpxP family protein refolding chaperone
MRVRHIILAIAAVAILAAPTTVLAQAGPGPGDGSGSGGWQGGHGPHGGGHDGAHGLRFFERMLPRLAEELGLSDEQLTEIETIVDTARPKIEEYANQLREGKESYRAANEDPTYFDAEAFRAHAEEQHKIQTELGLVVGQAKADVFEVLTPEQLEQFEEMRGTRGKRAYRRGSGRRSTS